MRLRGPRGLIEFTVLWALSFAITYAIFKLVEWAQ